MRFVERNRNRAAGWFAVLSIFLACPCFSSWDANAQSDQRDGLFALLEQIENMRGEGEQWLNEVYRAAAISVLATLRSQPEVIPLELLDRIYMDVQRPGLDSEVWEKLMDLLAARSYSRPQFFELAEGAIFDSSKSVEARSRILKTVLENHGGVSVTTELSLQVIRDDDLLMSTEEPLRMRAYEHLVTQLHRLNNRNRVEVKEGILLETKQVRDAVFRTLDREIFEPLVSGGVQLKNAKLVHVIGNGRFQEAFFYFLLKERGSEVLQSLRNSSVFSLEPLNRLNRGLKSCLIFLLNR